MGKSDKRYGLVKRHLPILRWLPEYNLEKGIADAISGVTVGLTVMPQALAYATLAGLDPQYGLYSSFMGCIIYMVLGSCKDITIGPTALMSLMTYQQVIGKNPDFAILLCLLTGCVQVLMGILHLGVLIDFISIPVTVGFTSATSVIIAVSQLKGLLGLSFSSSGFLDTLKKVYLNIHKTRFWDTTLGLSCILILLLMRKMKDLKFNAASASQQATVSRILWLLSISRNALVVVVCSAVSYHFHSLGSVPFILTGPVRPGLPPFQLPPFTTEYNNRTLSFVEMCSELGSSIVLVPVIAVLGNVAIAKAFGEFFGLLIILALWQLTPYFYFIPKASLAAVIICAVIFMIEYEVVKPMWRSSRKDLIPTIATFILCLSVGVEIGILIGVGVNIVLLIYPSARPSLNVEKTLTSHGQEYLLVTPDNSLYFPAVDFMRSKVGKVGVKMGSSHLPVVIDCRYILGADFTAAKGIAALIKDFNQRKQPIYFYNPKPSVLAVLKGVCLDYFIHLQTKEELYRVLEEHKLQKDKLQDESRAVSLDLEMKSDCQRRRHHQSADHDDPICSDPLLEPLAKMAPIIRPSQL
ncbi:sodium-independent sulfate anion transporter [Nilaparvata lugens]|uniref:sodium-independent sulfate anion transporter n=1 Tax=Nilaparvata lugens TaxID=108931 RepID=UPI00193DBC1E|nr:sodium-independent sulfate anion transporter [Nilaparvata lugens]